MKRLGKVYAKIISKDNLRIALHNACKGKSSYASVRYIKKHIDEHIDALHEMLKHEEYTVAKYREKKIYEPKERLISILPLYPDRIIQHAIVNVIGQYWDSLMISDSYSCRVGKGQHIGSIKCMEHCRKYKYVLKCDISKFYPSLNHSVLKSIVRRKIKDNKLIRLIDIIIDSYGDSKGVPIGSYLSQWLGNLYMNDLDMHVKHTLKCKAYIRYCDDFVIFANSKEELQAIKENVIAFCTALKLRMSKCDYYPTTQGIDFLGYRHFPSGKILLRKRTAKRFKKNIIELENMLKQGSIPLVSARSKVASMKGWLCHANTYNFSKKLKLNNLMDTINERISEKS